MNPPPSQNSPSMNESEISPLYHARLAAEKYANIVAPNGSDSGDWLRITKLLTPIIADCLASAPTQSAVNQAAGETPRTDRAEKFGNASDECDFVHMNFARQLERELNEANIEQERLRKCAHEDEGNIEFFRSQLAKLSAERDEALKSLEDAREAKNRFKKAAMQLASENLAETENLHERLATATRQNEEMAKEVEAERNLHGQTRVVVEELNTICNDLRNAGQMPFIRSEAIRHLREDQAELRGKLSAALAMVETMRGIMRRVQKATMAKNSSCDEWEWAKMHLLPEDDRYEAARARVESSLAEYNEAWNELSSALSQVPPTAKGEERP